MSALTFIILLLFSCSSAAFTDDHSACSSEAYPDAQSSCSSASYAADDHEDFLKCLSSKFHNYSSVSSLVYTPRHPSFSSVLLFGIWNLKYASESTPKPRFILTPDHETQIPPIIHCAKEHDLEIRIRSGGHDYDGLSFVSSVPFVLLDLINLSEITVDAESKTAWIEAGATLGALYYRIAEKSLLLGFPGGLCPTVGVGGHISGGGYGPLMRAYGFAADQVLDARIVDAEGRILNRESMGEDLFWAIRGGGGASFGVITAWKLQLVDVPEKVTVFTVQRTLAQNATQLVQKWQHMVSEIDHDLFLLIMVGRTNILTGKVNPGQDGNSISATFYALFLGGTDRLLRLMEQEFPELGLVREDCHEMSWIDTFLYFNMIPMDQREVLLSRKQMKIYMKSNSNYVQTPIPDEGLEGLWEFFREPESKDSDVVFLPFGGRMAEIPETEIPFPHRAGNLYQLNNIVYWKEEDKDNADRFINWSRRLYEYVTPYVLTSPRAAYFNYRDLDIGVNNIRGKTSYEQASIWGKKYFKGNFDRLVKVKTMVDPHNFFKNEQSIPPLYSKSDE